MPRKKGPEGGGIQKKKGKQPAKAKAPKVVQKDPAVYKHACLQPGCDERFDRKFDLTKHEMIHDPDRIEKENYCAVESCGFSTLQKSNLAQHVFLRKHKELSVEEYDKLVDAREEEQELAQIQGANGSNPPLLYPKLARPNSRKQGADQQDTSRECSVQPRSNVPTRTSSWTTDVDTDVVEGPSMSRREEKAPAFGERPFFTPQAPTNMLAEDFVNVHGVSLGQAYPGLSSRERTPDVNFLNGNIDPVLQGGYHPLGLPSNALGLVAGDAPASDGGLSVLLARHMINSGQPVQQAVQPKNTLPPITSSPNDPPHQARCAAGGQNVEPVQLPAFRELSEHLIQRRLDPQPSLNDPFPDFNPYIELFTPQDIVPSQASYWGADSTLGAEPPTPVIRSKGVQSKGRWG